jgi:hypothetical protein
MTGGRIQPVIVDAVEPILHSYSLRGGEFHGIESEFQMAGSGGQQQTVAGTL